MNANAEIERRMANVALLHHPLSASFELTSRCNAACAYCYIKDEPACRELSTAACKSVIDKLDDAEVLYLNLTGGEPFIRNDIMDILSHVTSKKFFKTSILTNGTLMTDEHIDFIIAHKVYFSFIRFSAFSHCSNIHDAYLGIPGALDNVLQKGERLLTAGIQVHIALNVLDFNLHSFEQSRKFFTKLGFYVNVGMMKILSNKNQCDVLESLISKDFFSAAFVTLDPVIKKQHKAYIAKKVATPELNTELCNGLLSGLSIDSQGFLSPCVSLRSIKIGTIFENKRLHDILKSSQQLAAIRTLKKTDIDGCKTCTYINACSVCVGIVFSQYGDLQHRPEQFCNFLHAMIEAESPKCL